MNVDSVAAILWIVFTVVPSGVLLKKDTKYDIQLHGIGASFPGQVYTRWMKSYKVKRAQQPILKKLIAMTYSPFSSGRGKAAMINQSSENDFGGSDSELSESDYKANQNLQMVPTMAGPIVIGYRLPNMTHQRQLRMCRLCLVGIYNGTIDTWNHTLLQEANPNISLPDEPIKVIARKESSGTTEVMTSTLASFSSEWNKTYGVFSKGEENSRWENNAIYKYAFRHYGMVDELERDYTVAYLPLDVADTYKLSYAQLENREGQFMGPTQEGVENAMEEAWKYRTERLTARLPDSAGKSTYPMASFTYFILNIKDMPCEKAVEMARFVKWIYEDPAAEEDSTFVSVTDNIGNEVQSRLRKEWTCEGQNVWNKLLQQFKDEQPKPQWILPLSISLPLFLALVLVFVAFLSYQRYKTNKLINKNDWDIPIEDIAFYPPKGFMEAFNQITKKDRNVRASFMSGKQSVSVSDSLEVPVAQVLHWPGKWRARTIGLRILQVPNMEHVDRDLRRSLVWMRDSIVHDNVVKFYGLTILDSERFIISDYSHKGTLSTILCDGKLNMNENLKLSICFDIASGMTFLHTYGIVHGLLRSSTCVIDSRWTVKVADWEYYRLHTKIANSRHHSSGKLEFKYESSNDPERQLKSQLYLSPEILRSDTPMEPTVYSDVYSFAVLVQEIFTRKEPYYEIADILSRKEIVEAIKVNSIRPVHSDMTPVKIKQIMEIAWADEASSRPSFDQIMKMLKNAHPGRKSVLDHMIDVMDEYSQTLEARVDEKVKEMDLTKKQFNDLLLTFLPPYATQQLMEGHSVTPINLTKASIMFVKITGLGMDLCCMDACESSRLTAELINIIDDKATEQDLIKIPRDHNLMIFIGNQDDQSVTKATVAMVTMLFQLVPIFSEWSTMSKWQVGLEVAMHVGELTVMVLDTKIPLLTAIGEGMEKVIWLHEKMEENGVLLSEEAFDVLKGEKFNFIQNNKEPTNAYWLIVPERTTSDIDDQSESASSVRSQRRSAFNSPTLRASLRRISRTVSPVRSSSSHEKEQSSNSIEQSRSPPDDSRSLPGASRSPADDSRSPSRSPPDDWRSRSRSPEMEEQQSTHLLLTDQSSSEPQSPEKTQTDNRTTTPDKENNNRQEKPTTNEDDISGLAEIMIIC